jgi:hypothetical protein
MKKLYKIYVDRMLHTKLNPLSYNNWGGLCFMFIDTDKDFKGSKSVLGSISILLYFKIEDLEEKYNLDCTQDGGGTKFRELVLNNDNELIENFNKLLKFLS